MTIRDSIDQLPELLQPAVITQWESLHDSEIDLSSLPDEVMDSMAMGLLGNR